MLVSQKWSPCNSVLKLQLVYILLECMPQVQAQYTCEVGQETNIKNNKWQWVLPYEDPCTCSKIRFGGMNTITPKRPFEPVYVDKPLVGNNIQEIRDHYKLNCIELTCPRSGSIKQATEPRQATGIVTWEATATGNYGEYLRVDCNPSSGSHIVIGKANIVCHAEDEKGNQQSCTFKVEVIDNEAPIFESCPSNISKDTDAGQPTAMVTWSKPQAKDNSGQVTISCNYDLGFNFTIGDTRVDCKAVDDNGNEQECHLTVTVLVTEEPIFESCPFNISQATDAGQPTAMVTWSKPKAQDNSGQVTISCNYESGFNFTIGDTVVDCKAIDGSDNENECHFTVSVLASRNCYDIQQQLSNAQSGKYFIFIQPLDKPLEVYCDMTTDGGGWLVIQRRSNGSVDFYRGWQEYKDGFGLIQGEFWLGNQYLHEITRQRQYELRVDLKVFHEEEPRYACYNNFKVKQENESYRLELGNYTGNAGDALTYHNGGAFSTKDVDNDINPGECAKKYTGAWWYKSCHHSNLNGVYGNKFADVTHRVNWRYQVGKRYLLEETEMKIRPRDRVSEPDPVYPFGSQ